MSIYYKVVAAGCMAFCLALPVWGRRYNAESLDKRPLMERLNGVPLAFIGTVTAVSENKAEFEVEHVLQGKIDGKVISVPNGGSSCNLRFTKGQRWIYGGSSLFHPSMLLVESGQPGQSFKRFDDSRIKFQPEWQTCQTDAECTTLPYGCTETAVNNRYLEVAREKAWRVGGDPRTLNCARGPIELAKPLCEKNQCGMWKVTR